jgi:hypothetical protein
MTADELRRQQRAEIERQLQTCPPERRTYWLAMLEKLERKP